MMVTIVVRNSIDYKVLETKVYCRYIGNLVRNFYGRMMNKYDGLVFCEVVDAQGYLIETWG